jgi:hypothetical protein
MLGIVFGGERASDARRTYAEILRRIPLRWAWRRRVVGWIWRLLMFTPRLSFALVVKPLYRRATGHETGAHKLGLKRL